MTQGKCMPTPFHLARIAWKGMQLSNKPISWRRIISPYGDIVSITPDVSEQKSYSEQAHFWNSELVYS